MTRITQNQIYRAKPLLDFIAKPESGGDYNIVWGGISKKNHPPRLLTQMSIGQVLAWQDSIDPYYMSEAAGKYQIMEDTLRGLYAEAGMTTASMFDEDGQDRLAFALLLRRGYADYIDGKISAEKFANSLAKEWASLPVVSGPKAGKSYYGGDGLNKSHVSVAAFMAAVEAAGEAPEPAVAPTTAETPQGWLAAMVQAITALFKGGKA